MRTDRNEHDSKSIRNIRGKIRACLKEIAYVKKKFATQQQIEAHFQAACRKVARIKEQLEYHKNRHQNDRRLKYKFDPDRKAKRLHFYQRRVEKYRQQLHAFPFDTFTKLLLKNETELARLESLEREMLPNGKDNDRNGHLSGDPSPTNAITTKPQAHERATFLADWNSVTFSDGYITIRHNGRYFNKTVLSSKAFLNNIKAYYEFKNVPPLEVVLFGSQIEEIKNEWVLLYHIESLSVVGFQFGHMSRDQCDINRWTKYTKLYYEQYLSFLFHTKSLTKLCEVCDDKISIVPAAEVVITANGTKTIHNSFLFPVMSRKGLLIIWESAQPSKASYVFKIPEPHSPAIQVLYDYIAGDVVNKRHLLIHSIDLQRKLSLKCRIIHSTFDQWNSQLNVCINFP